MRSSLVVCAILISAVIAAISMTSCHGGGAPVQPQSTLFRDPALEQVVADALGKDPASITVQDLATLVDLSTPPGPNRNICDLEGLQYCVNLEELTLRATGIIDLSPISGLSKLSVLNLSGCLSLSDIGPLAKLTNLSELNLDGATFVENLTPLSQLTRLRKLRFAYTLIYSLQPLATLGGLTELDVSYSSNLKDISALAWLSNLAALNLTQCRAVTDFTPIANLARLTILYIGDNGITDISFYPGSPNSASLAWTSTRSATSLLSPDYIN